VAESGVPGSASPWSRLTPGLGDARRRLVVAFVALVALLLIIVGVGLAVSHSINRSATDKYIDDAFPLKANVQDLVTRTIAEQAAFRGYLLTGDPTMLARFDETRRAQRADIAYVRSHIADHPIQAMLLQRARAGISALDAYYDAALAKARTGPAGRRAAQRQVLGGEALFASFRESARLMVADTDAFVRDARAAQDRTTRNGSLLLIGLGIVALAIALRLAVVVPRRTGALLDSVAAERDATAEAARRAETLQRLGAALAPTLDDEEVLRVLSGEIATTAGVDGIVVARVGDPGTLILESLIGDEPQEGRRRVSLADDIPIAEVARTGRACFFDTAEQVAERFPEVRSEAVDGPGASWAVLPLRAGGDRVGALSLRYDAPRDFPPDSRTFLLTLADQCAQALDRARLFGQQVHIAHILQQSLLPRDLPRLDDVQMAARYITAETSQEVGGDFYDVFEDDAGRLSIVVGDACGKGPEAASLTALARYTVRAVADAGATPAGVLGRLNAAMLQQEFGTLFMTAAHVILHRDGPERMVVSACRAGHPFPLVVRGSGRVETLGGSGTILGIFPDPSLVDVETVLEPGDTLLIFTDGLTEARHGSSLLGDDGLQAVASSCAGTPVEECADHLLRAASEFASGVLRDDVAVVILRFAPAPAPDRVAAAAPGRTA
jgi:CHASE3 domain sensor protein